MRYIQPLFEETLQLYRGRQGGEYSMAMLAEFDKWEVKARIPLQADNQAITFWRVGIKSSFEEAAKLLAYCVEHDANARFAVQQLYINGDFEPMAQLQVEAAKLDLRRQEKTDSDEKLKRIRKFASILERWYEQEVYPTDEGGWQTTAIYLLEQLDA